VEDLAALWELRAAEGGKSGVNEPTLTTGIAVILLASLWALVFVLAINYEPRLRPFPFIRLFEIGLIWYLPIVFAFLGAYFLIIEAIKPS
jgi:hypothetical protein